MNREQMTTQEAAHYLGVSASWVRKLIRENRLMGQRYGRDYLIERSELERFLEVPRLKTGRPPKK